MLRSIPGYEGSYYLNEHNQVVNKNNKVLKTYPSKQGDMLELHHNGQRERISVDQLLHRMENHHADTRID